MEKTVVIHVFLKKIRTNTDAKSDFSHPSFDIILLSGCGATYLEASVKVLQFVLSQVVLIQILLVSQ